MSFSWLPLTPRAPESLPPWPASSATVRPLRGESGAAASFGGAADGEHDRVVGDAHLIAPKLFAFELNANPQMVGGHLLEGHLAHQLWRSDGG